MSDCSDERLTQVKEELQKGDRGEISLGTFAFPPNDRSFFKSNNSADGMQGRYWVNRMLRRVQIIHGS